MKMPFGKYQDVELTEVPQAYLRWLRTQEWVGAWLVRRIDEVLNAEPQGQPETTAADTEEQRAGETFATFSVHHSGNVGQEILDKDGIIVAWTTDQWTAQVICKLLNENEELLGRKDKAGATAPCGP